MEVNIIWLVVAFIAGVACDLAYSKNSANKVQHNVQAKHPNWAKGEMERKVLKILSKWSSSGSHIKLDDYLSYAGKGDNLGLDSLHMLEILHEIESELEVEMPADYLGQINKCYTVRDLIKYLKTLM